MTTHGLGFIVIVSAFVAACGYANAQVYPT